MDFNPRITIESKVLPGVRFVLKRLSPARRAAFRVHAAGYFAKLRELQRERRPLDEEHRAAIELAREVTQAKRDALIVEGKTAQEAEAAAPLVVDFPDEKFLKVLEFNQREKQLDQDELYPAMVRTCLESIENYTIKGVVPDAEMLYTEGADGLFDEIADEADRIMSLSPGEQGNLQSPGTSAHPEAGQTKSTDASTAEPTSTSV